MKCVGRVTNNIERESNIELLRIILIFMVLLLHFNNADLGGMFTVAKNTENQFFNIFTKFVEAFSICAVDCFLIISGYFTCLKKESKISNVLNLIYLSVFYNLLDYLLALGSGDVIFSLKEFFYTLMPHRYFITFYCIVYIFSPFLNSFFIKMNEKDRTFFMVLLFFVFSVYQTMITFFRIPQSGLSTVSISGNEAGYNILNFVLCYYIGSYLRMSKIKIQNKILIPLYFIFSIIMTKFTVFWNYDSVFCILNSIFLFLIFQNMKIQSRCINFIAKSVFSVYIIHGLIIPQKIWKPFFYLIENSINDGGGLISYILYFLAVFLMFFLCLFVDFIQRISIGRIKDCILNKVKYKIKVDIQYESIKD